MIDSHCHLYEVPRIEEEVEKFRLIGGEVMVCAGAGVRNSRLAGELAERFPEVWATAGIHPESYEEVEKWGEEEVKKKLGKMAENSKVVAVGECGLDYTEQTTQEEKARQKRLFELNIKLARETSRALVVHCRNAFGDVYASLKRQRSSLKGIQMHCWTGNAEWARKFLDLECDISFGGITTFKKSGYLREVVKLVPEKRLLAETDAPYLAPEPVRGERNVPANVKYVIRCLAEIKGRTEEKMAELTATNARRLFEIKV